MGLSAIDFLLSAKTARPGSRAALTDLRTDSRMMKNQLTADG
jgi:hypothetical protein